MLRTIHGILASAIIAAYDNTTAGLNAQEGSSRGIFFKSDGTKIYILGAATKSIYQYTLPTPWVLTNSSYDTISSSVLQDSSPVDIFFKPDGTKMYMLGAFTDAIYQYTLPTPWVLTGATYDGISFSIGAQDLDSKSIFFKPDGTKMYMLGNVNDAIYQYTLPTPWVLTGATYDNVSFSIGGQDGFPTSLFFKSDGTKMYILSGGTRKVYRYTLPSAWVLTGAVYDNVSFSISNEINTPVDVFFKSDGTKMYILDDASDDVYQYSLYYY